jgi:hypothetical protein
LRERFVRAARLEKHKGRRETAAQLLDPRARTVIGSTAVRRWCGNIPPALFLARRCVHELPP